MATPDISSSQCDTMDEQQQLEAVSNSNETEDDDIFDLAVMGVGTFEYGLITKEEIDDLSTDELYDIGDSLAFSLTDFASHVKEENDSLPVLTEDSIQTQANTTEVEICPGIVEETSDSMENFSLVLEESGFEEMKDSPASPDMLPPEAVRPIASTATDEDNNCLVILQESDIDDMSSSPEVEPPTTDKTQEVKTIVPEKNTFLATSPNVAETEIASEASQGVCDMDISETDLERTSNDSDTENSLTVQDFKFDVDYVTSLLSGSKDSTVELSSDLFGTEKPSGTKIGVNSVPDAQNDCLVLDMFETKKSGDIKIEVSSVPDAQSDCLVLDVFGAKESFDKKFGVNFIQDTQSDCVVLDEFGAEESNGTEFGVNSIQNTQSDCLILDMFGTKVKKSSGKKVGGSSVKNAQSDCLILDDFRAKKSSGKKTAVSSVEGAQGDDCLVLDGYVAGDTAFRTSSVPNAQTDCLILDGYGEDRTRGRKNGSRVASGASSTVVSDTQGGNFPTYVNNEDEATESKFDPRAHILPDIENTGSLSKPSKSWISTDENENADNFAPDWELQRKLKTDEERYWGMRERWRNHSIPNPSVDLTVFSYRHKGLTGAGQPSKPRVRKRRLEDDGKIHNGPKKPKMHSCTSVYQMQIEKTQSYFNDTYCKLNEAHHHALHHLTIKQENERQRILNHYYDSPKHILRRELGKLETKQQCEVDRLKYKFECKLADAEARNRELIYNLKCASDENFTFNKFYNNLSNGDTEDKLLISEEEVYNFMQIEEMYEAYRHFYS